MDVLDIRVLKFETRYGKNAKREAVSHDWVLYAPAHNIKDCQTWERVDRITPPSDDMERDTRGTKMFHMNAVWSFIGPKYEAWKNGEELPEDGTPLSSWAGVDAGQVAEFKKMSVKTVEDLATLTDGAMTKVALPRVRYLREQAKKYLEGQDTSEMAQEIAETKEQLAASMELMEQMKAEMDAMKAERPKRTRRTKAEMEAA